MSICGICRTLRLDRKTVQRFARAETVDELLAKARNRGSVLDRFKPYLHERFNAGCTDAARLTEEIAAMGYRGSDKTVRRYLQPFRATLIAPPPQADSADGAGGDELADPPTRGPDRVPDSAAISSHAASRSGSGSPASIWWSAPNDSRSNRTHSAAVGSRTGEATVSTVTSRHPARVSACSAAPGLPRLNGPGWPGAGGGNCARHRMIPTGTEKKPLAAAVE